MIHFCFSLMFLRIKKVKGREYCYLVDNRWKNGRARQVVKKYLGKILRVYAGTADFFDFYSVKDVDLFLKKKSKKELVMDLIGWELSAAGFARRGLVFDNGDIYIDCGKSCIRCEEKTVVLRINDGYLCDYTLHKILDFRRSGDIEKDSVALARTFVDGGLRVPKEVFIGFFGKV